MTVLLANIANIILNVWFLSVFGFCKLVFLKIFFVFFVVVGCWGVLSSGIFCLTASAAPVEEICSVVLAMPHREEVPRCPVVSALRGQDQQQQLHIQVPYIKIINTTGNTMYYPVFYNCKYRASSLSVFYDCKIWIFVQDIGVGLKS